MMTMYLTDTTSPEEVKRAAESGDVKAFKLYPAGATTNSASGVTDLAKVTATLQAMAHHGMPLCVHGEVVDADTDVFDRERAFFQTKAAARLGAEGDTARAELAAALRGGRPGRQNLLFASKMFFSVFSRTEKLLPAPTQLSDSSTQIRALGRRARSRAARAPRPRGRRALGHGGTPLLCVTRTIESLQTDCRFACMCFSGCACAGTQ